MDESPTIAAIATAPGRGGVAVIRVSGPDAFTVAQALTGRVPQPGRIAFVRMQDAAGTSLDEGLLLTFRAPHSYTGEDVVEFQCHGGSVTPRRILEACLAAGARLARRGEFTERAFLNGKLSLDQAQAVVDLIDAKTTRAADVALHELSGDRQAGDSALRELYTAALTLSSTVEHALDVSEEELPPDFYAQLTARLSDLRTAMRDHITALRQRKLLRDGVLVVLAGPPNVGKSSLMNALLDEARAIVSDVPGTTRDSIEAWLDVSGWPVRLVDTAGLRTTADVIEAEGVRRTEELVRKADVIIRLSTQVEPTTAPHELAVLSKADLLPPTERQGRLAVSAKTGEGLAELRAALVARFEALAETAGEADPEDGFKRQAELVAAQISLADVSTDDLVLFGNAVRHTAEILGRLVNAVYSEDLLTTLFARFCVGK